MLVLSIYTPNITIAIELLGSFASCNVFVFPGMCMVAMARRFKNKLACNVLKYYGIFVMLTGALFFVIVMVQVSHDLQSSSEEHILCK